MRVEHHPQQRRARAADADDERGRGRRARRGRAGGGCEAFGASSRKPCSGGPIRMARRSRARRAAPPATRLELARGRRRSISSRQTSVRGAGSAASRRARGRPGARSPARSRRLPSRGEVAELAEPLGGALVVGEHRRVVSRARSARRPAAAPARGRRPGPRSGARGSGRAGACACSRAFSIRRRQSSATSAIGLSAPIPRARPRERDVAAVADQVDEARLGRAPAAIGRMCFT